LREGVLTPTIYDPTVNPLYRDVLTHYAAVALPCRVTDPDPSLLTASRRSSRTSSCAARTGSSSAASSSRVSAIAGRPSTPSTRLQREDDSPARVRARHRLVRDPTRGRALAGVVRDGQEPLGPSDRFRRDPTRSSRPVPGGPRPPRGARDARLASARTHDVAQVTAVQLLPFDDLGTRRLPHTAAETSWKS